MCVYCDKGENMISEDPWSETAQILCLNSEWVIEGVTRHNESTSEGYDVTTEETIYIPIEFCPKCGREL